MEQIRVDLGRKSYEVCDMDGSVLGVLTFNPSDVGIAGRMQEVADKLQETFEGMGSEAMTAERVAAIDAQIREQLDYALGAKGAADILLGGGSALAICSGDGVTVVEKVLEAVMPVIESVTRDAADKSNKRVAKHTSKYQGSSRGLAPDQK